VVSPPPLYIHQSPWGRCMGSECGPGGSQSRAVWCAHVEGWTTLHTNCLQSTRPANQQSCFHVCDWHKDLYDWWLGEWNQCVPVSLQTGRTGVCLQGEEGIQTREVNCVLKADSSAADDTICEYFEPKPRQEQACLIPCPQDCVVTEFTPWTTCSKTCGLGLQNRVRSIVAPPLFSGLPCPNLTEFQTCAPRACEGREMVFSLKVGGWSECKLASLQPPPTSSAAPSRTARQARQRKGKERKGNRDPEMRELIKSKRNRNKLNRLEDELWNVEIGYQSRQVVCVHRNGSTVSLSQCPHWSLPETFQSCLMTKDCVVSEWSVWGSCSKTCSDPSVPQGTRSRSRQLIRLPTGGGSECPQLEESQACEPEGDGVPPCATYAWRTTEWSECRVDALLSQQDRRRGNQTGLCGGGVQSREVYCFQDYAELHSYIYNNKDKQGTGICSTVYSFKFRRRTITNYPTGGEGNCPHLVEAIPCDDPSCFSWQLVKLEECIPEEDMDCGEGTQTPQVRCINSEGTEVEKEMCVDEVYPSFVPCVVPCPKDCALSLWTEWSTCSQTCSSKTAEGKQMRTRAILAYNAGEGGSSCPNTSTLQEVRNCNEHPCIMYHWQTGPWGPCVEDTTTSINSSSSAEKSTCTVGVQTRKVICVKVNVGQVPPKKCPEAPRPESVRPCLLPCKRDCIVTPFSEWTECPTSCETGTNAQKNKQFRYRMIIQMSANGGQECPDVLYEEKDCPTPSVCPGYRWKTHKWRKCQLVPWSIRRDSKGAQENCGAGVQTRAISCRQLDGTVADVVQCLKFASSMPVMSQPCQLLCRDDCQLSNWSKFSPCTSDCVGVRTRRRALVGKSKKKDKCKNGQMYPLSETQYCPCDKYNAQPVGNWSDCILPEGRVESAVGVKVQGDVKECGQGYRYQAMVCYDQDNKLVETSRCNSHGYLEEACIVPCPSDCKLSEWSNWSRCSKSCGSGVKVRSKWLREKPYNGGRPCPKLDHLNQVNIMLLYFGWTVCFIGLLKPCSGRGDRERTAFALRLPKEGEDCPTNGVSQIAIAFTLKIPKRKSLSLEKKWQMNASCTVECPVNCQLSDWSAWSDCSQTCGLEGKMWRRRTVVEASQGDGRPCPSQMEQWKPCPVRPCYRWQYGPWTLYCMLIVVCGVGLRFRNLSCFVSDGSGDGKSSIVEDELCAGLEQAVDGDKNIILEETCTLPCPGDCYLMEWSDWSPCQSVCVKGQRLDFTPVQVRSRAVIAQEPENIAQCPDQEWQSRPCSIGECYEYQWMGSPQPIWCQRSDGINVTGGCPPVLLPGTDQSCDPPCDKPQTFCSEEGVCMCEEGYTEVLTAEGTLEQCTPIPVLEIPTAGDKKSDVKTSRAINTTLPTTVQPGRVGRTWYLQPFGPDGKLKTWVYGVAAGVFVLLVFIVSMIYLACKKPKKPQRRQNNNRLKPLTLAYDGDVDM
uniref:Thrombospondin type-1 domain-containing protein 7A n=1 Tax=Sinocyclocheilus grahami TaxID=75366 RepID=A0A672T3S8_SINGR